jgi:FMN phosphatase YigB (HAD superfamily)
MKIILFDLGRTLEEADVLLPGALEALQGLAQLRSTAGEAPLLGLISDFDMPRTAEEIPVLQQRYYDILDHLGIRSFFEPVAERVTLSTEVGVFKPDERIFRTAIGKLDPAGSFGNAMFVTENLAHVEAARQLGMRAIHFRGPGQNTGDVDRLLDLMPRVREFLG